jgi:hypothetical protein
MWRVALILSFLVTACAEFPEVDAALAAGEPAADYPALLPFEELLPNPESVLTEADDDLLLARAGDLRNRADGLRGPVIDPGTRDRMDDGVTQP